VSNNPITNPRKAQFEPTRNPDQTHPGLPEPVSAKKIDLPS
jgi:hypothetical protein